MILSWFVVSQIWSLTKYAATVPSHQTTFEVVVCAGRGQLNMASYGQSGAMWSVVNMKPGLARN